jgi:hypothetical protein
MGPGFCRGCWEEPQQTNPEGLSLQLAIPEGGFKLGFAEAGKPHNGNGDGTEESQHEAR